MPSTSADKSRVCSEYPKSIKDYTSFITSSHFNSFSGIIVVTLQTFHENQALKNGNANTIAVVSTPVILGSCHQRLVGRRKHHRTRAGTKLLSEASTLVSRVAAEVPACKFQYLHATPIWNLRCEAVAYTTL